MIDSISKLENLRADKTFLCGNQLTMADLLVYCHVSLFVRMTHDPADNWVKLFPKFSEWYFSLSMDVTNRELDFKMDALLQSANKKVELPSIVKLVEASYPQIQV